MGFSLVLPRDDMYGLTSAGLLSSFSNREHWGKINQSPSPRLLLKVTPLETAQGERRDPVSAQSRSHVIIILFKEKLKSLFSSSKPTRCLIKTEP